MKIELMKHTMPDGEVWYKIYKGSEVLDTCLIRPDFQEKDLKDANRRYQLCCKNQTEKVELIESYDTETKLFMSDLAKQPTDFEKKETD